MRLLRFPLAPMVVAIATACSSSAPSASAPSTATSDAGPRDGGPLACLDEVPTPVVAHTATVKVRARFVRAISNAPVAGLVAEICEALDDASGSDGGSTSAKLACRGAVVRGTTDTDGYLVVERPAGRDALLVLATPPSGFPDMMPSMTPLAARTDDDDLTAPIPNATAQHLLSDGEARAFASLAGVTLDAAAGALLGLATDCNGAPLAGVTATLEPASAAAVRYVMVNGAPETSRSETTALGETGFFNVPPPVATIRATIRAPVAGAAGAPARDLKPRPVPVRAGAIPYVDLSPR